MWVYDEWVTGFDITDVHETILDTTDIYTGRSPYLNEPYPGAFEQKFSIPLHEYLEWAYGPFDEF